MKSILRFVCAVCFPVGFACPSMRSQDAIGLFHKMQEALGGADRIASIKDFEQTLRAERWNADGASNGTVHKGVSWTRPDNLRLDQVGRGTVMCSISAGPRDGRFCRTGKWQIYLAES